MSGRINYNSGTVWEDLVGYSRVVKAGNYVEVSGTVAADENGTVVGREDAYQQTMHILLKIEQALKQVNASMRDVVRTRMFVTDIARFEEYARAHAEIFGSIKPATSMIEVKALVAPEYLIEIEATAIVGVASS